MLDVFSRYVVGWMVAHRESATLAERFIRETCVRQGIGRDHLTIHADHGPAMTSKPVALLLADLGVTKTHARPHVSNDNPFSEAQFKTLKYRPAFPERFGSIQDARAHCHVFFPWYNADHRHSSLGLLTPHDVHYGLAEQLVAAHPERFPGELPQPPACPTEVWIKSTQDPSGRGGTRPAGASSEMPGTSSCSWPKAQCRKPIDTAPVSADPSAYRAARVAPDIIERRARTGPYRRFRIKMAAEGGHLR